MRFVLVLLLFLSVQNVRAAQADCAPFFNYQAEISQPEGNNFTTELSKVQKGIAEFTAQYAEFICALAKSDQQNECKFLAGEIINKSIQCADDTISVQQIRPLALAFLRNQTIQELVLAEVFNDEDTFLNEETFLRKKIWIDHRVIVLPGQVKTPTGLSKSFTKDELILLDSGYKLLKQSLSTAFGKEKTAIANFSHIWGAYGLVAKVGEKQVSGQFGEVYDNFFLQLNVVVNVKDENFTEFDLAQRIAHENAHVQDRMTGYKITGENKKWSETSQAQIFSACDSIVDKDTSLFDCRRLHSTWFNFHKTNYAAKNSAEFYGKMVDEFVRENLNLVPPGRYRCQNEETMIFWNEMEDQILGQRVSKECANN